MPKNKTTLSWNEQEEEINFNKYKQGLSHKLLTEKQINEMKEDPHQAYAMQLVFKALGSENFLNPTTATICYLACENSDEACDLYDAFRVLNNNHNGLLLHLFDKVIVLQEMGALNPEKKLSRTPRELEENIQLLAKHPKFSTQITQALVWLANESPYTQKHVHEQKPPFSIQNAITRKAIEENPEFATVIARSLIHLNQSNLLNEKNAERVSNCPHPIILATLLDLLKKANLLTQETFDNILLLESDHKLFARLAKNMMTLPNERENKKERFMEIFEQTQLSSTLAKSGLFSSPPSREVERESTIPAIEEENTATDAYSPGQKRSVS